MKALELKVPPVMLVIGFGLAMWICSRALPQFHHGFAGSFLLALVLVLAGCVVAGLGVVSFKRAGTTVNPMKPEASSSLVASGIYRVTRNPMYVGFLLWLVGWAVYLSNGMTFVFLPVFVLYMNRFQIQPEERALRTTFGHEFEVYQAKVRRWL
jgi:protein-S-isoprenylcysteine O-methyltransferase Ste14